MRVLDGSIPKGEYVFTRDGLAKKTFLLPYRDIKKVSFLNHVVNIKESVKYANEGVGVEHNHHVTISVECSSGAFVAKTNMDSAEYLIALSAKERCQKSNPLSFSQSEG